MAGAPSGFEFREQGGSVEIRHHGRLATTLRGAKARSFLEDVRHGDPQLVMARLTGNYKHGNERRGGAQRR